jgi:hypothetical protein
VRTDPWTPVRSRPHVRAPCVEMASRGCPSSRTEAGFSATIPRGYDTEHALRGRVQKKKPPCGAEPRRCPMRREGPPPLQGEPAGRLTLRRSALRRERRRRQRERERERRVSDADTSYKGPVRRATTLNCAIPQRNHANYNSLSFRPGPSPGLHPKRLTSIVRTDPNPVLCLSRHPADVKTLGNLYRKHVGLSRGDSMRSTNGVAGGRKALHYRDPASRRRR